MAAYTNPTPWCRVGCGLFVLNGSTLTPMAEAPYDNGTALQQLLAEHSELLPGDAMDPDDPRRFILVGPTSSARRLDLHPLVAAPD